MGDAQLVEQTLAGNASAFETLIRRWSPRLLAYARGLVPCEAVADDIAQECLLRAYRHLATLEQPDRFGPWLLSIAHRLVLDWRKAKARTEVPVATGDEAALQVRHGSYRPDGDPRWICEQDEQHHTLRELIAELPESLRQVLLIYYYDDVTYDEVAQMLGVSKATVNARLAKARSILKNRMSALETER